VLGLAAGLDPFYSALMPGVLINFLWDMVDMGVNLAWMIVYAPHICDTDRASFVVINVLVICAGAIILVSSYCHLLGKITGPDSEFWNMAEMNEYLHTCDKCNFLYSSFNSMCVLVGLYPPSAVAIHVV